VRQTVDMVLPFTDNSDDWALYLLNLPLSEWSWRVTWGLAVWRPWTYSSLFDGVPLPRVWGCTGYYPSLALRQFGGLQYPPRLGDLCSVTFDYVPDSDMWRLLSRVRDIWGRHRSEMVLLKRVFLRTAPSLLSLLSGERGGALPLLPGLLYGQACHIPRCLLLFGSQPLQAARGGLLTWGESLRRLGQSWWHYALPGYLRMRSLRLAWSPCGVLCIIVTWQWRTSALTWRSREGMSSFSGR
jgi:hypothetical protein